MPGLFTSSQARPSWARVIVPRHSSGKLGPSLNGVSGQRTGAVSVVYRGLTYLRLCTWKADLTHITDWDRIGTLSNAQTRHFLTCVEGVPPGSWFSCLIMCPDAEGILRTCSIIDGQESFERGYLRFIPDCQPSENRWVAIVPWPDKCTSIDIWSRWS